MDRSSQRTAWPLFVLAFCAGGALLFWARHIEDPSEGKIAVPFPEVDVVEGQAPQLRSDAPRGVDAPTTDAAPRQVVVFVRRTEDGAFLEGAQVTLLPITPGKADDLPGVRAGRVLATAATAATDAKGRAALHEEGPAPAPGTRAVTVRYAGLVGVTRVLPETGRITISLSGGLTIRGLVVEAATGRGLAGIPVTLASADLPQESAGQLVDVRDDGTVIDAVSDPEGQFEFQVPGTGRFLLRAGNDEWVMKRPRRGVLTQSSKPSVVARAGETGIRLKLDALRFVRFELVDNRTGARASTLPTDILPTDLPIPIPTIGHGRLVGPASLWSDGRWTRVAADYGAEGVYAGVAPLAMTMGEIPSHVRVMLRVPRFRPMQARLRLLSRKEFESGAIDSVNMERVGSEALATLRIRKRCPYEDRYLTRKSLFVHTWDVEGGGYSSHQATRHDDMWIVRDLPARALRVVVDDGVQLSEEQRVDLSTGGNHDLRVTMPPATGFTVGVRSPRGVPILSPTVWANLDSGLRMRVPDFTASWGLPERLDGSRRLLWRVPPGRHKVQVFAPGGGWLAADIKIVAGEVAQVRGVLNEPTERTRR